MIEYIIWAGLGIALMLFVIPIIIRVWAYAIGAGLREGITGKKEKKNAEEE